MSTRNRIALVLLCTICLSSVLTGSAPARAAPPRWQRTTPPLPAVPAAPADAQSYLPLMATLPDPVEVIGSIGGPVQTLALSGTMAYIGEGSSLVILDISAPAAPVRVGQVALPGLARDIQIVGSRAYVAADQAGLLIFDISNPIRSILVGQKRNIPDMARSVYVVDHTAYVVTYRESSFIFAEEWALDILDVGGPGAIPVLGGYRDSNPLNPIRHVQVVGGLAYLTTSTGIEIIDVSDPKHATRLGDIPVTRITDVQVSDSLAYVTAHGSDQQQSMLHILDVGDPNSPVVVGSIALELDAQSVRVEHDLAYIGAATGLHIVDVGDPAQPQARGMVTTSSAAVQVRVVVDTNQIPSALAYAALGQTGGGTDRLRHDGHRVCDGRCGRSPSATAPGQLRA